MDALSDDILQTFKLHCMEMDISPYEALQMAKLWDMQERFKKKLQENDPILPASTSEPDLASTRIFRRKVNRPRSCHRFSIRAFWKSCPVAKG